MFILKDNKNCYLLQFLLNLLRKESEIKRLKLKMKQMYTCNRKTLSFSLLTLLEIHFS